MEQPPIYKAKIDLSYINELYDGLSYYDMYGTNHFHFIYIWLFSNYASARRNCQ